ncbi:MAG: ATP--guanido phosphotransferase [Planctomycetes bacterium]|nr:ATP--guanido phosphotransferase [Planctomycetota bacterium]
MSTVELTDLEHRGGEWLRGGGVHADTVISSRVRLARNIEGYAFVPRASEEVRQSIVDRLKEPLAQLQLQAKGFYVDIDSADDLDSGFLVERHLISRELQNGSGPRGVAFGSDEVIAIMVNEEDHLRIQAVKTSFAIREAYEQALRIDQQMEQHVPFAASDRWGYLTSCPTNVGTGLRASVMLHLPALVQMKQVEKLFHATKHTGLTVRGFYGEGTMASGDLYQISNQVTLGKDENAILEGLEKMLPAILRYESRCRDELQAPRHRLKLEDRCHRALALLRSARMLSSDEAMQQLSLVRLGLVLGVLGGIELARVNELFALVQPAHVQKLAESALESSDRDAARAALVRRALA